MYDGAMLCTIVLIKILYRLLVDPLLYDRRDKNLRIAREGSERSFVFVDPSMYDSAIGTKIAFC